MQKSGLSFVLILWCFCSFGQEKTKKIHDGKVISVDVLNLINLTLPTVSESDTRWSTLPGSGWSGGIGIHYQHDKIFSVESHYIMETQRPQYDRQTFRISLPYRMHTIDFLAGKTFASERNPLNSKYIKAGIQYHLSQNLSYSIDDDQYKVSAIFSNNFMGFVGQVGLQANLSGNHHLDFGFVAKYNPQPVVVYELQAKPEKNSVSSDFYPFYLGAKLTYRFSFLSFNGKSGSNNNGGTVRGTLGGE